MYVFYLHHPKTVGKCTRCETNPSVCGRVPRLCREDARTPFLCHAPEVPWPLAWPGTRALGQRDPVSGPVRGRSQEPGEKQSAGELWPGQVWSEAECLSPEVTISPQRGGAKWWWFRRCPEICPIHSRLPRASHRTCTSPDFPSHGFYKTCDFL